MNNIEKSINCKLKNKISDFCMKLSENIWKVESKFSLDMIFWLLSSWSILLSEIWRNLKEKINIKQTIKRLSSNLNKLSFEKVCEIKDNLLIHNKNSINKETVISLDWWDINKNWALKMENLKKIHDGSKWKIEPWYCLNSIVATNIDNNWKPKNIPLNLNLYSTKAQDFVSENNESIKSIDEVIKILWTIWIWVFDRWYDRMRGIFQELLERNLTFIIRAIWTRNVYCVKNNKKIKLKTLAENIKTRKRITYFEYKTVKNNEKNKWKNSNRNTTKKKIKLSWRVWFEKIKISGIKEELTLCVLKKLNWELSMMMITNMKIENNTDVVKVFSKYSCRWWVEDTYKFMKQEFKLEKIMLKNYKSLQNMMIFLLASMNFITNLRKKDNKYFTQILIEKAKALNWKLLKMTEHSIIAWIRVILALNSLWIRDFLRKKIKKLNLQNLSLFRKINNPYEILGKL